MRAEGRSPTSAIAPSASIAHNHSQELGIANSHGCSEDVTDESHVMDLSTHKNSTHHPEIIELSANAASYDLVSQQGRVWSAPGLYRQLRTSSARDEKAEHPR